MDLVEAHQKAIERLDKIQNAAAYNIGTGQGYSVLELVAAFEQASGQKIPYEVTDRRSGNVAILYADTEISQ